MAKDAKNNKEVKNKKHFFKDFKAELKKVIWPTPKQIVNNTIAVITIVIITAAIVFVLDFVFNIFNEKGVNKLKSNIRNKTAVENVIEENTETNSGEENMQITVDDSNVIETTQIDSVDQNSAENVQ